MSTWQFSIGHVWRYDNNDVPFGMHVRFSVNDEAIADGRCGCECGVCKPEDPHNVADGCICDLLGCSCTELNASAATPER